jgi:hypothetical protein
MTDYEKVIKIHEKSLIPADIIESSTHLQSYLEEYVIQNRKHELIRLRTMKAETRRRNLAIARKITVSVD